MVMIEIDYVGVKNLREDLCAAQNALLQVGGSLVANQVKRLGHIIDQVDFLRPLGPDGKHGDRHTDNCGCEDK